VVWARVVRSQEERALACLIDGAVGDAFGYEVESSSLKKIGERGSDLRESKHRYSMLAS